MPAWTLRAVEILPATDTVRATLTREHDGDTIARHIDAPIPPSAAATATTLLNALATRIETAMGVGHTVTAP